MALNKKVKNLGAKSWVVGKVGCPSSVTCFTTGLNIASIHFLLSVLNILPFYLVLLHFLPKLR